MRSGYQGFREDVQRAHALMDGPGIPHDYEDGPLRAHRWDSGWVEPVVQSLDAMLGPQD